MKTTFFRTPLLAFACVCMLAACGTGTRGSGPPPRTSTELTGSTAERVDKVTRILGAAAPTPLLDANFIEIKIGDGVLGPSDYVRFIAITIDPASRDRWRALSPPLIKKPEYAEPPSTPAWWVSQADYERLSFHDASSLGLGDGWLGVADNGRVFVATQTR